MKYYRFKRQIYLSYATPRKNNRVFAKGELLTENEFAKYGLTGLKNDFAEIIEIPKNQTFKMFGVRFECRKGATI